MGSGMGSGEERLEKGRVYSELPQTPEGTFWTMPLLWTTTVDHLLEKCAIRTALPVAMLSLFAVSPSTSQGTD
jgi:hypothetical protein